MKSTSFVLLGLLFLCSCSAGQNITGPPGDIPDVQENIKLSRSFPDFSLVKDEALRTMLQSPVPGPLNDDFTPAIPGPVNPSDGIPPTPYAFTRTASASTTFGRIYYSAGPDIPQIIQDYGHSPMPSGDWVYFIQPPDATPPGPARWNMYTHNIEYLDTSMVDPPCNYLVPAAKGNAYIYAAIGFWGTNPLQGWIHIVKNGQKVWSNYGSYLFPTLSDDASKAAWCFDSTPGSYGDRDVFIMNTDTYAITKIHNVGLNEEAQYVCLTDNGRIAGFTVVIRGADGLHDQEPWRWQSGKSFKIPNQGYRWCEGMSISAKGKYQVWPANPDPYIYSGYAVQCYFEGEMAAKNITNWNSTTQDIWVDVDKEGFVIYANGVGLWSHYVPAVAHVNVGYIKTVFDPGAICRDFKFMN